VWPDEHWHHQHRRGLRCGARHDKERAPRRVCRLGRLRRRGGTDTDLSPQAAAAREACPGVRRVRAQPARGRREDADADGVFDPNADAPVLADTIRRVAEGEPVCPQSVPKPVRRARGPRRRRGPEDRGHAAKPRGRGDGTEADRGASGTPERSRGY
jgi:hypothetical protein